MTSNAEVAFFSRLSRESRGCEWLNEPVLPRILYLRSALVQYLAGGSWTFQMDAGSSILHRTYLSTKARDTVESHILSQEWNVEYSISILSSKDIII
jgi:hypothetical protein